MIKKFFKSFDMFTAVPSLRVKGESEHASVGAGVLSLLILMAFGFMFIKTSVDLLSYKKINSVESTRRSSREGEVINNLNFAFGLKYLNIFEVQEALQVNAWHVKTSSGNVTYTPIELVPCKLDSWDQLGEEKEELFQAYGIESLACPKYPQKLEIYGAEHSSNYQTIQFYLEVCTNYSYTGNQSCHDEDQVDQVIESIVLEQKYIEGIFIYLNTGFNPSDKDPLIKFIDQSIWITFTHQTGTEAFVQIGTYSIQTDTSFSPFEQKEVLNGTYLANFMSAGFERGFTGVYAMVEVSLSPSHRFIERKYGKIDEAMSYAGGLFGLVMSILGIFFMSFNEYRYELIVGEGVFSLKDGNKMKEKNFHFHSYVKYVVYDWVKILLCCEPQWEECQKIDETREEAIEQIDVQLLLKRIQHLEKAVRMSIPVSQDISLYVTEPASIFEVKKRRKLIEYFEKIVQDRAPLTIKNADLIKNIVKIGIGESPQNPYMESSAANFINPTESAKNSIQIINEALKQYQNYLTEEEASIHQEMEQEDLVLEKQISDSFYNLEEEQRMAMIYSIPLIILNRLKRAQENHHNFENNDEILSEKTQFQTNDRKRGLMSFIQLANASRNEPNKDNRVKNSFRIQEM